MRLPDVGTARRRRRLPGPRDGRSSLLLDRIALAASRFWKVATHSNGLAGARSRRRRHGSPGVRGRQPSLLHQTERLGLGDLEHGRAAAPKPECLGQFGRGRVGCPIGTVSTSSSQPEGSRITDLPLATPRPLSRSGTPRAPSIPAWHCRPMGAGCCMRRWTVPAQTSCWLKTSARPGQQFLDEVVELLPVVARLTSRGPGRVC